MTNLQKGNKIIVIKEFRDYFIFHSYNGYSIVPIQPGIKGKIISITKTHLYIKIWERTNPLTIMVQRNKKDFFEVIKEK